MNRELRQCTINFFANDFKKNCDYIVMSSSIISSVKNLFLFHTITMTGFVRPFATFGVGFSLPEKRAFSGFINTPMVLAKKRSHVPDFISTLTMKSKKDFKDDCHSGKSLSADYAPKTENQKEYYAALRNTKVPIVLGVGPAGTGKTLFACTTAIEALKRGDIQKIVMTRPIVPVDEEELGFLPGDLKNKMAPWTQPLFDIFLEYYSKAVLDAMVKDGVIEISPLAFMRGRTFKRCYVIADEMQNSSPNQMMMLTTRIGTDTRMFITGDLAQTDRHGKNGLVDFSLRCGKPNSLVDQGMVKIVNFDRGDVERSEIVNRVVEMYSSSEIKQNVSVNVNGSERFFNNKVPVMLSPDFPIFISPVQGTWSPNATILISSQNNTKTVANNDCALIPKAHYNENL